MRTTQGTIVLVPVFKLDSIELTEVFNQITNKERPCWTSIRKNRFLPPETINSLGLERCYPHLNQENFRQIFSEGLIAIFIIGVDAVACTKENVDSLNLELENLLKIHNFLYASASEEEARRDLAQIFP